MVIYVAAPFSHPDESVRNARFEAANAYAAKLMEQGHIVFSPLSHSVPISRYLDNPNDSKFYVNQDLYWLQYCYEVHVLMLPGYDESKGIKREIERAFNLNIPVLHVLDEVTIKSTVNKAIYNLKL